MTFQIDVFTIFPSMISNFVSESLLGKAIEQGNISIRAHDLREGSTNKYRSVDDAPFGGGAGMVLAPEPVFNAVEKLDFKRPLFLLSPTGRRFEQAMAKELACSSQKGFSLLCGRYEGVDERISRYLVDDEISIGDYILAGGEVAALVVIEAVSRLLPGVMGNDNSAEEETFSNGLLEYPQYTRPRNFRGWQVPSVLLSGNHSLISQWRYNESLLRTLQKRPDLIQARGGLCQDDVRLLQKNGYSIEIPGNAEELFPHESD